MKCLTASIRTSKETVINHVIYLNATLEVGQYVDRLASSVIHQLTMGGGDEVAICILNSLDNPV
jgi:hypothetical protein